MKTRWIFLVLVIGLTGCATQEKSVDGKLHVVTTTGMLYDAVINIAGDAMTAEAIMGPGVDPHLYKATQGDLGKLRAADIIIYNGILLEGKMGEILEKLGRTKPVLAAAEAVPPGKLMNAVGYENAKDPHIWFDVSLWKIAVMEIAEGLSEVDTTNRKLFSENATKYLASLDTLDQYVKDNITSIPPEKRVLVTAHDAFGYFGAAYDIDVKGLQGISTVSDFGLKDIADVTDLIIDRKIPSIFVETSVSEKAINAVISGCKERGHNVEIGGYLYSDAMGEFGTFEGTYIGMVKSNVDTIVEGLTKQ